jgi:hypothetical protein
MTFVHRMLAVPLLGCLAGLAAAPATGGGHRDSAELAATRAGVEAPYHLFRAASADTALGDRQRTMLERARASKAVAAVSIMAGPPSPMLDVSAGNAAPASIDAARISIALNASTVLTATRTSVDVKADAGIWRGTVDQTGAMVALLWWPNGELAGTVQHEGRFYSIRPMGGRLHAVVELDGNRLPPEHAPAHDRLMVSDRNGALLAGSRDPSTLVPVTGSMRPVSPHGLATRGGKPPSSVAAAKASDPTGDVVIDVIAAYTPKAAGSYADIRRDLIELAVEEANESFRMSKIGHVKLRLVHAYQTNYAEDGVHFDHLWRFADKGDGHMEEIHRLREQFRADVALLIIDDPKGCGLATRVHADAEDAFAVVHHECAAATHSVAHEIGHIIGTRHELSMDQAMSPFPYGHGYVNGTKWRDIMSYKESCGGCARIPVWSSPKVLIKGEPAGTADLDNARVIAEQAARVAAFR